MVRSPQRSVASVIRRAIDWHRGMVDGRPDKAKKYTLPPLRRKKSKSTDLDRTGLSVELDAAEYLGEQAERMALPVTSIVVLILLRYFDLLEFEPRPRSSSR